MPGMPADRSTHEVGERLRALGFRWYRGVPNVGARLRIHHQPPAIGGGRVNLTWMDRAACKGAPIQLFYPEETGRPAQEKVEEARQICYRCPVLRECHDWANATKEPHGVWAAKLRNGRPKVSIAHGTEAGAQSHRRAGEPLCGACSEASKRASRLRAAANKDARRSA